MAWPERCFDLLQRETHFGNREVWCFKDRPADLYAMFRMAVARNGEGEALVADGLRVTYRELDAIVSAVADSLIRLGIARGDRIAMLIGNRPEFLYVLLAAIRIGALAVPINIREQTPELTHILNHCGARLLVHEETVSDRLPSGAALKQLEHLYSVDGDCRGSKGFAELLDGNSEYRDAANVREEDVAVILYTSGTTGLPKGAMLTHFNVIHSTMHFALCMELEDDERALLAVPASHVTGLVAILLTMIRTAGCTVFMKTFEARSFLELAACERVTMTLVVPAIYNLCLLRADFDDFDLSRWRIGGYGGAPMPEPTIAALAARLPDLELVNAYGSTEVTSPATMMPPGLGRSRSDSVGIVLPCAEIRIVDESGHDVPGESHGELWIKGPMVVPGYWDNDEKTRESFDDGYWKSGDIGSRDADGFIRLHDRKKDMIIRGGYNIYSAEIENVLTSHPDVIECAAVGRADPVLGERTEVFVVCHGTGLTQTAVQSYCAQRLADYKVPDFVTFLSEALPRNANGKILKSSFRRI